MTDLRNINAELQNIADRFDFNAVAEKTFEAQQKLTAAVSTNLGKNVNEVINGFQSLTQEIDDTIEDAPAVINRGIAMLVDDPGGIDIRSKLTSAAGDLQKLTETAVGGGMLKLAISAATPEALSKTLNAVSAAPLNKITDAVKQTMPAIPNVTDKIGTVLNEIERGLSITEDLTKQLNSFQTQLSGALNEGLQGVVNNVVEKVTGDYLETITGITAGQLLPDALETQVKAFVQNKQLSEAATILQSFSNLSTTAITTTLGAIPTSLSQLLSANLPLLTQPIKTITTNQPTNPIVANETYVGSELEVQAILSAAQRDITTVVVGSTKTHVDQDVKANDAPQWHFLITRSGDLQPVVPIDQLGSYTANWNTNTVGIAFAGGTGVTAKEAAGTDVESLVTSRDYTRKQWNTFDIFMKTFFAVYPYGQVVGVKDVDETTGSPAFDVRQYVKARFGKTTIVDVNNSPPSIEQLRSLMEIVAAGFSAIPDIEDEPVEIRRAIPQ